MPKPRLAGDPLAALLPAPSERVTPPRAAEGKYPSPGSPMADERSPRTASARITVQLDQEVAEQVRDAVMWLHTVGVHTTISAIAAAGLRHELDRLTQDYRDGSPFPPRTGNVPVGRPPH